MSPSRTGVSYLWPRTGAIARPAVRAYATWRRTVSLCNRLDLDELPLGITQGHGRGVSILLGKEFAMKPVILVSLALTVVALAGCNHKRPPGVLEDTVAIPPPPSLQQAPAQPARAGTARR